MFCNKCGAEIKDGAKFCRSCGNLLPAQQPFEQQFYEQQPFEQQQDIYSNAPQQFDASRQFRQQAQNGYNEQFDNGFVPNNYAVAEGENEKAKTNYAIIAAAAICMVCILVTAAVLIFHNSSDKAAGGDSSSKKSKSESSTAIVDVSSDDESSEEEKVTTTTAPDETETTTTTTTTAETTTTTTTTTAATTDYGKLVVPDDLGSSFTMYVNTESNNLMCRFGPGYEYDTVFADGFPKGMALTCFAEQYDPISGETWAFVQYGDTQGWCTEKYLSSSEPKKDNDTSDIVQPDMYNEAEYRPHFQVVVDGLKLRKGPGTSYDVITMINSGTELEEYGYNLYDGKWVYTNYNGKYGWLMCYKGDSYDDPDYKEYIQFFGGKAKPVIYLYPEKRTDVSVELKLKNGHLGTTYPKYDNGWNVTAYPDGTLINKADGGKYEYLFWDSVNDNTVYDMSKGFVVKGEDTEKFLRETLDKIGLNEKERNEFIVYWLPLMERNEYNLISFQTKAYTDTAELDISPKPDSVLRVFMAYKPIDKPIDIEPQNFETFTRNGFTAVEWGGTEIR
ncbi:MAG: SH3 domain-containing protein [Ruminococcus sp.]|nr:SH3 domain-containing protein [Ruminococcus sp.]